MLADETAVPAHATLLSGLSRRDVEVAIARSGYPFQAVVADRLSSAISRNTKVSGFFGAHEEWSYTDSDSGQARTVDILVSTSLGTSEKPGGPLSHPSLQLLVECKQSELPFTFFLQRQTRTDSIDLHIPEARSSIMVLVPSDATKPQAPRLMQVRDVFGALDFRFFNCPVPHAFSVSKIKRSPKPEVTGEEAHRSLTLPLMKAADHLDSLAMKDHNTRGPVSIIICLVVVRAPMVGVWVKNGEPQLSSMPWYRVLHHQPFGAIDKFGQKIRTRYYDVVHEEYLDQYISIMMHALNSLADRIHIHDNELRTGIGMGGDGEKPWETLRPVPPGEFAEGISVPIGPMVARIPGGYPMEEVDPRMPSEDHQIPWSSLNY
ncbi:hypothetical protein AB0H71_31725 [Nocardia sp. NPDC050697]|uniref:hypothetical protein n=1 Tax=Nocardia sp. NPDC050697 TaxID=3155158 RepID=UPI0033CAA90F